MRVWNALMFIAVGATAYSEQTIVRCLLCDCFRTTVARRSAALRRRLQVPRRGEWGPRGGTRHAAWRVGTADEGTCVARVLRPLSSLDVVHAPHSGHLGRLVRRRTCVPH